MTAPLFRLSTSLRAFALSLPAWGLALAAEQSLAITQGAADGIYAKGATITWQVEAKGEGAVPLNAVSYVVHKGGATEVSKGTLDLSKGPGTVTASLDTPGTLMLDLVAKAPAGSKDVKDLKGASGAAVEPKSITAGAPCPADFDAFWADKLKELAAVPANPQLTSMPSDKDGVDYWQITMDNIRGTHIRGQIARPHKEGPCPAMLIVQWAGVYALPKNFVTEPASRGWLVLNISAHDLPIDQPKEFYKEKGDGELKGYTAINNDDREKSYFLRMFLSCSRGVDWLAGREDWNHKALVTTGGSQGGLQSFVTAGLNHQVTAILLNVPAGCDNNAALAGRTAGWPNWVISGAGKDAAKVKETANYFDGVNFAARVTCPALVGMGLVDTTSRPDGVFAAINSLKGPVETVPMPLANHMGKHDAYYARNSVWQTALLKGETVLPAPATK